MSIGAVFYLVSIFAFPCLSFIDPISRDVTGKNPLVVAAAWVAGLAGTSSGAPAGSRASTPVSPSAELLPE